MSRQGKEMHLTGPEEKRSGSGQGLNEQDNAKVRSGAGKDAKVHTGAGKDAKVRADADKDGKVHTGAEKDGKVHTGAEKDAKVYTGADTDSSSAPGLGAADRHAGLRINAARLERSLAALGRIGQNAAGGLDRTTFTPAELEARAWLQAELAALGLSPRLDEAANIWAVRPGADPDAGLPHLVFGSHVDTVPNGGKYDGALGVLLALEVLRVLEEHGIRTRHPFALVSFSAEEPNPFGLSTFGSRSIAGKLSRSDLEQAANEQGVRIRTPCAPPAEIRSGTRTAGGTPKNFPHM